MNNLVRVYQNKACVYGNDNGTMYFYTICMTLPETVTLEDTLKQNGVYLFCPEIVAETEGFCRELEAYLVRCPCRLLWIENPGKPYSWWRCYSISNLERSSVLRFGRYCLTMKGKTELLCRKDVLILSGAFSFSFFHRTGNGMECQGEGQEIQLSVFGEESGSLRFCIKTDETADAFAGLNTGIRYAMPLDSDAERGRRRGFLSVARVQILKKGYCLLLQGCLTPYAILDENRSYLELPEMEYESCLTDRLGRPVRLHGKGKLVFEKEALYTYFDREQKRKTVRSTYYLGIGGSFIPDRQEILLGLSGTEFVGEVKQIAFIPHGNGFLEEGKEGIGRQEANPVATASWISVEGSYCSSSKNATFFSNSTSYFRPVETRVAAFETLSPACPVFFWKEAGFFNSREAEEIDARIYQMRFEQLTSVTVKAENRKDGQEKKVVTPQGLCACIGEDAGEWSWVGIAQSLTGAKENSPDIRLCHIKKALQVKFQDRDTLFFFENGEELLELCEPSEHFWLEVNGWTLLLHPKDWKEETCMILKYTDAVTVAEYMQDNDIFCKAWKNAHDGSGHVRTGYETFVSAVTDRFFQGIIFLNVKVDVENLSEGLSVVMRGVEKEKLSASYVAIERSRLQVQTDGGIVIQPSDVSAVISYSGESIVNHSGSQVAYDFQTKDMVVVIENSVLKSFESTSELLINKMFLSAVSVKEAADGNCLVIKGSLQESGGVTAYQFILSQKVCYIPEDSAMLSVEIEEVKMHDNGGQSEFLLSGTMIFTELAECDLFAYGTQEKGLCFSGLKLVQPAPAMEMYCDYTQLQCMPENSQIRPESLAAQYGAVLEKIVVREQSELPDEMGYSSINTPVRQGQIQTPWIGMVWKIGLGSLGGLSSQQAVSMNLMTAWCQAVEGTGISYYVGLKLPPVLNGGFCLQGLLKVGFQSISLLKNSSENFFFQFHNISIRALTFEFPPGSTDIFIFGQQGNTGWYAAYTEEEDGKKTFAIEEQDSSLHCQGRGEC